MALGGYSENRREYGFTKPSIRSSLAQHSIVKSATKYSGEATVSCYPRLHDRVEFLEAAEAAEPRLANKSVDTPIPSTLSL